MNWLRKNKELMDAWWKWMSSHTWRQFERENELYEKEPDE